MESGYYIRTRDGRNVDIVFEATDAEVEYFIGQRPDEGWKWFKALRKFIRDNAIPVSEDEDKVQEAKATKL